MDRVIKIVFFLWVILWITFIIRPLFKQGYLKDYRELFGKSLEERRAYVYGKELYNFLKICLDKIPQGSTYKLVGIKDETVDKVRAVYFLYPNLIARTAKPGFILVYGLKDYQYQGYSPYYLMDEANYILKRN